MAQRFHRATSLTLKGNATTFTNQSQVSGSAAAHVTERCAGRFVAPGEAAESLMNSYVHRRHLSQRRLELKTTRSEVIRPLKPTPHL